MPVVAVAGIYMGGAALAAGGLSVMGTIAALGSIVGGIGALTGNKTMMKIGAVAGLAGGIGAFAQSQGWMASAGGVAAEQGVSNTAAMANQSSNLVENVAPTVDAGMSGAGGTVTQGIGDAAAASGGTAGLEGAAGAAEGIGADLSQSITQANPLAEQAGTQAGGLMSAGAQEPVSSLSAAGTPATGVMGAGEAVNAGMNPTDMRLAMGTQASPLDAATGTKGGVMDVLGKFGDVMKNNKDLVKIAGDFIGGAFDDKKKAETDFLTARSDEIRQQMANANDVPNGRFRNRSTGPLFKRGQPTYRAPRIGGLMNAR
jgi:hypothetical protein